MAGSTQKVLLCAAFLCVGSSANARPIPFTPASWIAESEAPAHIAITARRIEIDTPKGMTLWFRQQLSGPIRIEFDASMIAQGGPNDAVSDLNAFWMAREADGSSPIGLRSGRFEDYDTLQAYYLGIGGNRNTTTRMRRYIAIPGQRPLLPEHDRKDALLVPNRWIHIGLIADGHTIAVERDGTRLFTLNDPAPYASGWFALRTTWSHLAIRRFSITPIKAKP
jgi:hypothetical protein